jgi:predicted acyl esterase
VLSRHRNTNESLQVSRNLSNRLKLDGTMDGRKLLDLHKIDKDSFEYIYEENVTIKLQCQDGVVRANVYRPKGDDTKRFPVLVTYGPYGKDIHYSKCVPFYSFSADVC